MQHGKRIGSYLNLQTLQRLDTLRGNTPRSAALGRALAYLLSQDDTWVRNLICDPDQITPSIPEQTPTN